ncbi:MAG: AAA family ATPase [Bacteroidales bacterium]|nr:AAA family ATPase [Bacteroidales bacterium]
MAVAINTTELKETLYLTPASQNVMLVGKHGIGKSEILTQHFQQQGMRVITLFLGQMADPGDIIGLPARIEKKDADGNVTAQTDFTPPYWFPTDGQPVVLFLDELNRARPEILQTVMDLTLNRTLAGKSLPEGSRVIAAVNDGEEYQLTDLDPALVSRFNVYEFRPKVEEWLNWAMEHKLDDRVVNFIQSSPSWLDGGDEAQKQQAQGLDKTPDRRAWKKVSDIMRNIDTIDDVHKLILAGVIGTAATVAFVRHTLRAGNITGKDLLTKYVSSMKKVQKFELHELAQLNESIFLYLEHTDLGEREKNVVAKNLTAYVEWLADNKQREALANFTSIFEKGSYTKALTFMLVYARNVYDHMIDYIDQI